MDFFPQCSNEEKLLAMWYLPSGLSLDGRTGTKKIPFLGHTRNLFYGTGLPLDGVPGVASVYRSYIEMTYAVHTYAELHVMLMLPTFCMVGSYHPSHTSGRLYLAAIPRAEIRGRAPRAPR